MFNSLALACMAICHPVLPLEPGSAPPQWEPGRDPALLAHWPLAGNGSDRSPYRRDASSHRVQFPRQNPRWAIFDGQGARLEVGEDRGIILGKSDFTLSLYIHTDKDLDDDIGDLFTMRDHARRSGVCLSVRNNGGVTSSQANFRQLQFGIDAGSSPTWSDLGRPGNAALVFSLATHDGRLYAGTADNKEKSRGTVHRYEAPGRWTDTGWPGKANAVSAMAEHQGLLYAGSTRYRFSGSALPESENPEKGGAIHRLNANGKWEEAGILPGADSVGGMAEFKGRLYATSLYKPAGFFRLEPDGAWKALPTPGDRRVESIRVQDGFIWASSYDGGKVYRFDGNNWQDMGQLGENTQTYSFVSYRGSLCVGTWPSGKVYRFTGNSWEDMGRLGNELEVMGMLVHNGDLYAGTLPLAHVFRYEDSRRWADTGRLDDTPGVKYRRAWTMAQFNGRLCCGLLPSGRVFAMKAGPCVTLDKPLESGWRHIAAIRRGGTLELHVDGLRMASSEAFNPDEFDLNRSPKIEIGSGQGDTFRGKMTAVRFFNRALDAREIMVLSDEHRNQLGK